ncbi:TPA: aminotransferase class I/II-fold pyridoxal phosphate-dependent enzyme [Staphylococcus pseudintermedius]
MPAAYRERRASIYKRLTDMKLPVILPQGAFYIFPDVSAYNQDSFRFCNQLLEWEQLAIVPGKFFTGFAEGYVRLSFVCDMPTIEEACNRLNRFLSYFQA